MGDHFDEELNKLLNDEAEHPATTKARDMCAAIWRFFGGAPNEMVGDARTVAFTITAEMVDTKGNRWIRHAASSGDGEVVPPWQVKGYLHDALDWANAIYESLGAHAPIEMRAEQDNDDDEPDQQSR